MPQSRKFYLVSFFINLILPKNYNLKEPYEFFANDSLHSEAFDVRWRLKFTFLAKSLLGLISIPLRCIGFSLEFILNLFNINGGIFTTIIRLLTVRAIIPNRESESFLSIVGLLEHRTKLYNNGEEIKVHASENNYGKKCYADLCSMVSTLVYENEMVVKNRVTIQWKMHFVGFFNFWNDYLKKRSTQAFILCDKEEDAQLIVLAFRGTELFNADDWKTDVDTSWCKIPKVGKIHVGFLEALGIANRKEEVIIEDLSVETLEDPEKPLAYYTLVKKLNELLQTHKNARIMVTGHSLGGALSVLLPALLVLKNEHEIFRKIAAVYTFGQPRVGDAEFGKFMDDKLNQPILRYFRVVYCNDAIPKMPIFMFKHFGTCLYFDSSYKQKNYHLTEEPNVDYYLLNFIPLRLNAVWEAMNSLILATEKGQDYKENKLCFLTRLLLGPLFPGFASHCMVNYVNAVRLGPSELRP